MKFSSTYFVYRLQLRYSGAHDVEFRLLRATKFFKLSYIVLQFVVLQKVKKCPLMYYRVFQMLCRHHIESAILEYCDTWVFPRSSGPFFGKTILVQPLLDPLPPETLALKCGGIFLSFCVFIPEFLLFCVCVFILFVSVFFRF